MTNADKYQENEVLLKHFRDHLVHNGSIGTTNKFCHFFKVPTRIAKDNLRDEIMRLVDENEDMRIKAIVYDGYMQQTYFQEQLIVSSNFSKTDIYV